MDDICFADLPGREGNLGVITLNRPKALNALNHNMLLAMHEALQRWADDREIKAVVVRAAPGRAFCAGGDLRWVYERHLANESYLQFFKDEYQLNSAIYHYPKPYIAFLDGITMGGGAGISINGSHCVATEQLLFAMPETGIGFFPDVGGTYFLSHLPGKLGWYLGLTGARIGCDDCVSAGLVQHKVQEAAWPAVVDQLLIQPFGLDPDEAVTKILTQFTIPVLQSPLILHQAAIEHCFSCHTVEDVIRALEQSPHIFCRQAAVAMLQKSPTSLKVTHIVLQRSSQLDFDACMQQEYRLTTYFSKQADFMEGIRATIIEKDNTPHWRPDTLSAVNEREIKADFERVNFNE
ncbi:MAG: hypothetical protein A3F43_02480 [Gammaproteobacteria bacterium RIFCSPHIGHO2_12_FULL_42_10]|nr:MAG: hypothetical protein A3F43_02480 [Gammaproteobacteria bacterium RIFCSPHIGHO2_12_FULL_42_10]